MSPTPPGPTEHAARRAWARERTARNSARLDRLVSRLPPQGPAKPGELTVVLGFAPNLAAALFLHLVCTAVQAKYQAAGRPLVAAMVARRREQLTSFIESSYTRNQGDPGSADLEWLATRRVSQHATRYDYGDPDLRLCDWRVESFAYATTPWVCQQPDWRYRWTSQSRRRLHFLADCWRAYAQCDFTLDDARIGVHDFPLSDSFLPEPCP